MDAMIQPILPAADLEQARTFYREKLGLREVRTNMQGGLEFEGKNGTRLYVFQRDRVVPAEHTVAGLAVADLDRAMSDLRKRGVTFEEYDTPDLKTVNGVHEMEGHRVAWFRDPAGHYWAINEVQ